MGIGIGAASYMAYGLQTAFGTPQTSLTTAAFIRTGSLFTARNANAPRSTTAAIMPKASQLWQKLALVDFDASMEYVFNDTALLPLFTAAFGRRFKSLSGPPWTYSYTLWNPPVAGGLNGTPTDTIYNFGLTVREVVSDGAAPIAAWGVSPGTARVVQDICINRFTLTMNADEQLRFQLNGTGQKQAESTAPSFTDISGTTAAWVHANSSGTVGLYSGTANPPSAALLAKSVVFTLENNMRYEPFLGATAGNDMKLPTRAGWPTAQFAVSMDFEDAASGFDAVTACTAFVAATRENFAAKYQLDTNDSIQIQASSSTGINIIDDLKPVYSGEGVVGLTFNLNVFPNNVGQTPATGDELILRQVTAT